MTLFLCPSEEALKSNQGVDEYQEEVRFAMFAFTDPKILALKFCASKGVRVFGVVDKLERRFSAQRLSHYRNGGITGDSITIHDKTFVIDRNIVITGSANASLSGWGKIMR